MGVGLALRLAHFGTFDIRNYGDLLFPLVVEHHLKDQFDEFVHISPVGGKVYGDVPASKSLHEVLSAGTKVDAVLVGGGNIVHARPSSLPEYLRVRRTAYPSLWAGAAKLAARQKAPFTLNAPGIPRPFTKFSRFALGAVLGQTEYLAVRDTFSAAIAEDSGAGPAVVVPDSALNIAAVLGTFDALGRFAPDELGELLPGEYVAVHINDRYASSNPLVTASLLDKLSSAVDRRLCLIAIGPCHGDDFYARKIAALMTTSPVVFDNPETVSSIAWVIAGSKFYIGSSLHGFITATSYGVPAALVASHASQHKFQGFAEQVEGADKHIFGDWNQAVTHLQDVENFTTFMDGLGSETELARARLETHWNAVRSALSSDPAVSSPLVRDLPLTRLIAGVNFLEYGLPEAVGRRVARVRKTFA